MVTLLLLACATATDAPADTGDTADTAATGGDSADSADATDSADTADTGPDAAHQDADGDGYTPAEGDCDDTRDSVYPGAPDYCDGIDADCDGEAIPCPVPVASPSSRPRHSPFTQLRSRGCRMDHETASVKW